TITFQPKTAGVLRKVVERFSVLWLKGDRVAQFVYCHVVLLVAKPHSSNETVHFTAIVKLPAWCMRKTRCQHAIRILELRKFEISVCEANVYPVIKRIELESINKELGSCF